MTTESQDLGLTSHPKDGFYHSIKVSITLYKKSSFPVWDVCFISHHKPLRHDVIRLLYNDTERFIDKKNMFLSF